MTDPEPIDPRKLRPGPIRNESLPPEMLEQIRVVYDVIGSYVSTSLEQFEIVFMRDASDKTARLLISVAPAGLEQMFFEVGQPLAADAETAPPPSQADIEKLLEAAPRYGVEIKVPHHD